jgi:hypothetical protein
VDLTQYKFMEIIEGSSGYWIVDSGGAVDGPFDTFEAAQKRALEIFKGD